MCQSAADVQPHCTNQRQQPTRFLLLYHKLLSSDRDHPDQTSYSENYRKNIRRAKEIPFFFFFFFRTHAFEKSGWFSQLFFFSFIFFGWCAVAFCFLFQGEEVIRLPFSGISVLNQNIDYLKNVLCLEGLASTESTPNGCRDEDNRSLGSHGGVPHVLHHILSAASGTQPQSIELQINNERKVPHLIPHWNSELENAWSLFAATSPQGTAVCSRDTENISQIWAFGVRGFLKMASQSNIDNILLSEYLCPCTFVYNGFKTRPGCV